MHKLGWIGIATASLLATGGAFGQTSVYRSVTVTAGKTARVAAHSIVRKDCSRAAAPEIQVSSPPKNGTLIVRAASAKPGRIKNCPDLAVPLQVLIYRANPGFTGQDSVTYELKKETGAPVVHTITITVRPQDSRPPRTPGAVDL